MFGSRVWFSGAAPSNSETFVFQKSKMAAIGYLGYTKMAITLQSIGAIFGCTEV